MELAALYKIVWTLLTNLTYSAKVMMETLTFQTCKFLAVLKTHIHLTSLSKGISEEISFSAFVFHDPLLKKKNSETLAMESYQCILISLCTEVTANYPDRCCISTKVLVNFYLLQLDKK